MYPHGKTQPVISSLSLPVTFFTGHYLQHFFNFSSMNRNLIPLFGLTLFLGGCGSTEITTEHIKLPITVEDTTSIAEEVSTSWSPSFKHDNYLIENPKGFILLCHQAGWSRGEYMETAPIFNSMGYSCMAIDQRSGAEINGVENIVASMFNQDSTTYVDAIPDISFAIDKAFDKNNQAPIILLGSSYSSALALILGPPNDKVKAIISFSPGEYFEGITITDSLANLNKPLWITSSVPENPAIVKLVRVARGVRGISGVFA